MGEHASEAATADYFDRHSAIQAKQLGQTALWVSPAGFGGYRIDQSVPAHGEALRHALASGINLIDTSTNYGDGGSEKLVGQVLNEMVQAGQVTRQQVVVVSKIGYLQGSNYALSQERKAAGRGYPDLVLYGKGLEHCIHPEFIEDQLTHALQRLQLDTLDILLLHNPEYYLGWAHRTGIDLETARIEFYRRIRDAFGHLEHEVQRGRIQFYGISSNTFPADNTDPEFVSLDEVLAIASDITPAHHFRVVQFPLNILEPGGALTVNQSRGRTLLQAASDNQIGVLINRPLNAITGRNLIRLADVESIDLHSDDEIIAAIRALNKSEVRLWRKLLPALDLPAPLYRRIMEQADMGKHLKHYWKNFGSYDRWRQFKDHFLWPHLEGVFDYLEQFAEHDEAIREWIESHRRKLEQAAKAVGSLYVGEAKRRVTRLKDAVMAADTAWAIASAPLSQMAVRVLRATKGVTSVLVGMRRFEYVTDIIEELQRPVVSAHRASGWESLRALG